MNSWAYGARPKSSGNHRKLSDNVELPKNYPAPQNGGMAAKSDLLVSVQNLPAVLTDPRKGQYEFYYILKT